MVESPWGPLAVADAHVHFFSHGFFEKLVGQAPGLTVAAAGERLGWRLPAPEPSALAGEWIAELDRHGVDRAALIASIPGDEGSTAAAAAAHRDRFFAFAMVNPKGWREDLLNGIDAACLFPAMHLYSMTDQWVQPVFAWARRERRAVFVHCGALSVGVRKKLGLESRFDLRFSNPIDVHAVAHEYADVPIIIPHFGAGYFREALMVADLCPNVYLDTSSSNSWMRYQESHLDLRHVFKRALEVVGPQRLLFGTDSSFFPRGWHRAVFEDQAKALYEIGMSWEDAQAVFSGNLLHLMSR